MQGNEEGQQGEIPGISWSWRESNPRPPSGHRPRYDHSRVLDLRLSNRRVGRAHTLPSGLSPMPSVFLDVSGLSLRSTTASVAGLQ